jgi:hypothetical protein
MKSSLITAAALSVALVGCKTTEPPTFEQETNDIYVWDDSKSTAKNWADIAVVPNGVKDAERAEDAQELISEAEQNAWTLVSFASGGIAQGLGMSSVFGIIDDAQRWWPTYVVLVEPQNLTPESILEEVSKQFQPAFAQHSGYNFEGVSYRTHSRNWANATLMVSGSDCTYEGSYAQDKDEVLSMPETFQGCFIDVMIEVMPRIKTKSGRVYDVIAVEQRGAPNKALRLANQFDGPVVFPVNYRVKVGGKDTKLPFPFVLQDGKAHLFTETNASVPLNIQ